MPVVLSAFPSLFALLQVSLRSSLPELGAGAILLGVTMFALVCAVIWLLVERLHASREETLRQEARLAREIAERDAAERAEHLQRDQLQQMLRSIGDAVIVTDASDTVVTLNGIAEQLTGWSAAEVIGQPIGTVFHVVDEVTRTPLVDSTRRSPDEGRIFGFPNDAVLVRRDGMGTPIDDSSAPIHDAQGRVTGSVIVFRDISERRRAERARVENERDLSEFFEHVNVGLHWASADGTILRVNREELRMLGYEHDEYVGRNIAEFHVDQDVIRDILARLAVGEIVRDRRAEMRCKDGTVKQVMINCTARREHGRTVRLHSFMLDVSERVAAERAEAELRQSEARFRMIADNIAALAWTTDEQGVPTWYNRRWYDFTGMPSDPFDSGSWEQLQHPAHAERIRTSLAASRASGDEWEDTYPLRGADGTYRWFLSRFVPIRDEDGTILRWFGTNVDVTERVEMEAALRDADRRKDEFVATLAHELRNPLAPLQHALHVLEETDAPRIRVQELVAIMLRQLGQMTRMVDDLIDLSRVSRGKLELRRAPTALDELIRNAVEMVRPMALRERHHLVIALPDEPIHVNVDAVRMTQVFTNLLRNACKFTDAEGHVTITAAREDGAAVITVEDDGIGIPADRLQHVFQMFAQGHRSAEESRGGLGIGLTLVKLLVELHGGSVEAHSEGLDRGSRFTVRLDTVSAPVAQAPAHAPERPAERVELRVLVADDNRDSAETLAMLLQLHGCDVTTVYDGEAAVETFATLHPALVILDIGMPKRSGYDVCRAIREQPGGRDTLVVALTGWGQAHDRQRSHAAGFDMHLVKPVDHVTLMQLLRDARR